MNSQRDGKASRRSTAGSGFDKRGERCHGDTILGPIDYLAVEWPGRHVTGEGFRLLMDLVERGIVRVLDILFIGKDADGTVSKVDVADVEHSEPLDKRLCGLTSGLLHRSDIHQVAAEASREASPESSCMRRLGSPNVDGARPQQCRIVGAGRILADDLIAASDASDPA